MYKINLNIIILKITAIIAPREEYFNFFTTIIQIHKKLIKIGHEITDKKPIKLATPFPPLNFNQTGNIWPNIQNNPHKAAIS